MLFIESNLFNKVLSIKSSHIKGKQIFPCQSDLPWARKYMYLPQGVWVHFRRKQLFYYQFDSHLIRGPTLKEKNLLP